MELLFTSSLYRRILNEEILSYPAFPMYTTNCKPYIIGDDGFPLRGFLMKVYDGGSLKQLTFNQHICSQRAIVEQVIGQVKSRFRQVLYINTDNPTVKTLQFLCACILHNFIKLCGEGFDENVF